MKENCTNMIWAKFRTTTKPAVVGGNTILLASDNIISFINVETGESTYNRACGDDRGDSVSCITGHKSLSMFAFAEDSIKPRIFIFSYPEFKLLQTLQHALLIQKDEERATYLELSFFESEYLIALSAGIPSCQIEIWNWRSGKLLVAHESDVHNHDQFFKCTQGNPLTIAQYIPQLRKLNIWESYVSLEEGFLIKRSVTLNFLNKEKRIAFTFGIDANLYAIDSVGNLYMINIATDAVKDIWKWTGCRGSCIPNIAVYRNGYLIAGSDQTIKFVKKLEGCWRDIWTTACPLNPVFMRVLNNEKMFCVNETSTLYQLKDTESGQTFEKFANSDLNVKFFDLINPVCQYFVAITYNEEMVVVEIEKGNIISSLHFPKILCICSSPSKPFIAIGGEQGDLILVSTMNPESPKIVEEIHLSSTGITRLTFSRNSCFLVAKDRVGNFFVAHGQIGSAWQIVKQFKHSGYISDFCCLDDPDNIILIVSTANAFSDVNSKMTELIFISKRDYSLVSKIVDVANILSVDPLDVESRTLVASKNSDASLHVIHLCDKIMLEKNVMKTAHQLKHIRVQCDENYIISFGIDGILCIFDRQDQTLRQVCLAHSRRKKGVKFVRCTSDGHYVISLGHSGNLYVFSIAFNREEHLYSSQDLIQKTQDWVDRLPKWKGFIQEEERNTGLNWLELKSIQASKHETKMYAKQKKMILEHFHTIQNQLRNLIDSNEKLMDEEKIDTRDFNLNEEWSKNFVEMAFLERASSEKALQAYVAAQTEITQWIIDNTWNRMQTNSCKVRGIDARISIENFGLWNDFGELEAQLTNIKIKRNSEQVVTTMDTFLPWQLFGPLSNLSLSQRSQFYASRNSNSTELSESSHQRRKAAKKLAFTLSGTSSYKFINPFQLRYQQLEIVSYDQMFDEEIMGKFDLVRLRKYFNKHFDDLRMYKERTMKDVKSRNETLRDNHSELKCLAELRNEDFVKIEHTKDPVYELDENPEYIIQVRDSELKFAAYISPSTEDLLVKESQEAEERRSAILADDFQKRTLIRMMDGVLEKRWQDEIKKNPDQPECIKTQKNFSFYTRDDYKAIKDYDEKMASLISQRDEYRMLLQRERIDVERRQADEILSFNKKCADMCILKFAIGSAIEQEELKLLRIKVYNHQKVLYKDKEKLLLVETQEKRSTLDKLATTIEELERCLKECRMRYDQLQLKDSLMDKQFRSQLSESAPQIVIDAAYKIFKKRPKWTARAWATSAILSDIATRISTKNSSKVGPPIPDECYEFLRLIDSIESYANAPTLIDNILWVALCKIRRIKMESEFRLKACGVQLAEAEAALNAFLKEQTAQKSSQNLVQKQKEELKHLYQNKLWNRAIQLVMNHGSIEISLSGRVSDFDECILISSKDITDVNALIKRAGQKKLKAIQNSALFRRKIIFREWQHKELRMNVENSKKYFHVVEKCKVTRETQQWVKHQEVRRAEKLSDDSSRREVQQSKTYLDSNLVSFSKHVENAKHKLRLARHRNRVLDKKIQEIDIEVSEQSLKRDFLMEETEMRNQKERMVMIIERGRLVRKVQAQHAHIMELATLLELQRLRTFPTLSATQKNIFP